jgi:hypothetical protein
MVGCYGVVSTVKRRSNTVIFQRSLALVLKVYSPSVRLLKVAGLIGSRLLLVPPQTAGTFCAASYIRHALLLLPADRGLLEG